MYESAKIEEAKYFLDRMRSAGENPRHFAFELSATLAAARSALQYALEECKHKPGGQAWYDGKVSSSTEVRFLKGKRDVSIHGQPINPLRRITIQTSIHVQITDSLEITVRDKDGNVVDRRSSEPTKPQAITPSSTTVSTSYHFDDWTGKESVDELCSRYVEQIQAIIDDGRAKGFLTA